MTMIPKDLDLNKISKLIFEQTDSVTCVNCCRYYLVPTTAICGHTLCHSCWRPRHICPTCGIKVEKKDLMLNLALQNRTEHVIMLGETLEELFKIKLDELTLVMATNEQTNVDRDIHIKEWLASSQNQFSAPLTNVISLTQGVGKTLDQVVSNIQIHCKNSKKEEINRGVVHKNVPQDDWDKIEVLPEIKDISHEAQENIIGPTDIETFDYMLAEKQYTTENPRRSSRKKETDDPAIVTNDRSPDKDKGQSLNNNLEKVKPIKNWNNVKKMRTEFSKLNRKKNRNKLNVSIEMFKKTTAKKVSPQKIDSGKDHNNPKIFDAYGTKINDTHINNHKQAFKESNMNANSKLTINTLHHKNLNQVKICNNNSNVCKPFQKTEQNSNISLNNIPEDNKQVNNEERISKVQFLKKGPLQSNALDANSSCLKGNHTTFENNDAATVNTDDIEITIKVGNTITNIFIKKKDNDVQLKINSDREVQTTSSSANIDSKENESNSIDVVTGIKNNQIAHNIEKVYKNVNIKCSTSKSQTDKSVSNNKNTSSADTSSINFKVSESVENQLVNTIESKNFVNNQNNKTQNVSIPEDILKVQIQPSLHKLDDILEDEKYIKDIDIFECESAKEGNVQSLKSSKNAPSAILIPTFTNKSRSQKLQSKRKREENISYLNNISSNKKLKTSSEDLIANKELSYISLNEKENTKQHSEHINYDVIMNQVFANIDADISKIREITATNTRTNTRQNFDHIENVEINRTMAQEEQDDVNKIYDEDILKEKFSENIFTLIDKDCNSDLNISSSRRKTDVQNSPVTVRKTSNVDKSTTENNKSCSPVYDMDVVELSTPKPGDDDDTSIVEETPQKSTSFGKNKNKIEITTDNKNTAQDKFAEGNNKKNCNKGNSNDTVAEDVNIIRLSDSLSGSIKNNKIVNDTVRSRTTLETPLNINRFNDNVTHKSTPVARKSLNFNDNLEDPEETLCPSSFVAAKTTQEREFMSKAFEQSMSSPTQAMPFERNRRRNIIYYIAGSCLTPSEIANLKILCSQRNWTFLANYTKDLTHLIVGVDEENRSQRSVKYMCALASSKWIVSYKWVEKCLQTKDFVDEEPFEALDHTGEPGPRRSRLSKRKLFIGITFYCMPPFGILGIETLKDMLQVSGGKVVDELPGVRATEKPALLLAEPEHTQEDRFIYLAMELSVVPVNFEWVLNCLGSYTLSSIYELLLCPASLLQPVISKWPPELITRDNE